MTDSTKNIAAALAWTVETLAGSERYPGSPAETLGQMHRDSRDIHDAVALLVDRGAIVVTPATGWDGYWVQIKAAAKGE
jgi:hypothetical protein